MAWMKLVGLLLKAHLRQRPFRTLLTVVGVALGVSASVAVRTANIEVLQSFEQAVVTVAGPTTLEVSGGDAGLDERLIASVRPVAGVASASPVLVQTAVRLDGGRPRGTVQVLGLDLLAELESRGFHVTHARVERPLADVLSPDSMYLGKKLAQEWRVEEGSSVLLQAGPRQVSLTIAGVIEDPSGRRSSWDRLAIMDIAAAQVSFGLVGRLDRIDLITDAGADVERVAQDIRTMVPPHLTVDRPVNRTRQVEQMVRAFRLNLTVLSWVGLLVGMFLIYNTMAFAVAQRRREIGIYRAVGMTERRVAWLFLAEATAFGLLGGIVGSVAGILLAQKLVALVSRTISDLYTPIAQGGGAWWESPELWQATVEGVLIGCVVSMIGALGPSLDASRTATVRALAPGDYESTRQVRAGWLAAVGTGLLAGAGLLGMMGPLGGLPVLGYVATFCLLAGLSCLAPVCITGLKKSTAETERLDGVQGAMREIAVEHAARNPGRNGVTVSALMVGLAIMVGVLVMVRSFRHTVELWINETVIADIVVAPSTWLREANSGTGVKTLPPQWREVLAAVPGIADVDTYRDVRVEVNGQRVAIVSRDMKLHARRSQYLVRRGDSTTLLNEAVDRHGVIVSEVLANRVGVEEGAILTIVTPQGPREFPVVAVFYDYATDGGKLVMDRALYQSFWQDETITVFPLYLSQGERVDDVRRRIADRLRELDAERFPPLIISNAELRKEILDIFDRTFLLTYVLEAIAVIIAMLGIVNTLVTSVLERRREFATLRAIGSSDGQIRQLVLWEAAYLGTVGIALGLVGGGLLSLVLIKVINKQSFGWTIQMILPFGALAQAVGLAAAATLVAGYFPARWAAQQPVVEGLREE